MIWSLLKLLNSATVAKSSHKQCIYEQIRLCSNKHIGTFCLLHMDKEMRISYNFHAHEILLFFDLFQPLKKNVKVIHSLWAGKIVGQKVLASLTLV